MAKLVTHVRQGGLFCQDRPFCDAVENNKNQFYLNNTFIVVLHIQYFHAFLDNYAHSIGILEFQRSKY